MSYIELEEHFAKQWDNPPKPFNPAFKPYAKETWDKVMALVEREEREDKGNVWDRPLRARKRRETYNRLMSEIEKEK